MLRLGLGVGLGLGLAVAGCSGSAPAPTTGPTVPGSGIIADRGALGAHQPKRVTGARLVGHVDPSTPIDLVLGLKLHDRASAALLLKRQADPKSADFRRFLTPAQFADAYAPSADAYAAVATAAEAAGLTVTRKIDGRTTLSVNGPASAIEKLFGTELDLYDDGATAIPSQFRSPSAAFTMPAAFAELVDTVVGLDDAYPFLSKTHHAGGGAAPQAFPGPAEPADLRTLYNVDGAPYLGEGETIGILGAGLAPAIGDVKAFINKYSLATDEAAQLTQVLLGGPNRDPPDYAQMELSENILDIDMVLAIAPKANVVHVVVATNAGGLFGDGLSFLVNQVPQAHNVTVSYGTCERVAIYEALQLDSLLLQAQTQGQTWFFASGDNGTDDCQDGSNNFVPSVEWPASSPYALGVGGTQYANGVESAWVSGGGGLSELFPIPSWQVGVGAYADRNVRMVPDVAALAGAPSIVTIEGGQISPLEGTSAATPMWAAIWALVDQSKGGGGIPDYHDVIYNAGKAGTGAFNDITTGANGTNISGGYNATVGFDLATGWGSPNLQALIGAIP